MSYGLDYQLSFERILNSELKYLQGKDRIQYLAVVGSVHPCISLLLFFLV